MNFQQHKYSIITFQRYFSQMIIILKILKSFFFIFLKGLTQLFWNIFMLLILVKRYKGMASIKGFLYASLVILLFITLALHAVLSLSYVSQLQFDGEKIQIKRDQFNIANIKAPSLSSGLYAWGYATAEDRLFQIGFRRKIGQGRLSELFGQKGLAVDKMMRQINFYGQALETQQKFKKDNFTNYKLFEAYTQGINDCVKNKNFLPLQYYLVGLEWEQWKVADSFLMYKLLKWSQSQNFVDQYLRSLLLNHNMTKQQIDKWFPYTPENWIKGQYATQASIIQDDQFGQQFFKPMKNLEVPKFKPIQVDEMLKVGLFDFLDQGAKGSNSWVIGGNLTESGHPILANDPHLDSALPGQWQQIRVNYLKQGKQYYLNVATLAGIPAFIGQSSYFSLSMTTTYSDTQDLYKQTINDKNQYLYEGQWRPLKIREQVIYVKGNKQPLKYNVYQTHHGPIMKNIGYRGYMYQVTDNLSLCWAGASSNQYQGLQDFIYIAEIQEYDKLISMLKSFCHHAPPMNMVYITKDDHYGYISVGPTPKRRHPYMGMYAKDGSKAQNQWIGFVQPHQRLHVDDNQRGYISTANNKPTGKNFNNGLFDVAMYTGRADRIDKMIRDRIKSGKKFNKQFMKQMQFDTIDIYCQQVVNSFKNKLQKDRQKYQNFFGTFENFDCNFTQHSTLSSVWIVFYQNIMQQLKPQPLRGKFSTSINYPFNCAVYKFLNEAESSKQLKVIQKAYKEAEEQLQQFYGTKDKSKYIYSQIHKDWMKHRPFSQSKALRSFFEKYHDGWGNLNTPNVAVMAKIQDKDYRTDHRANIRTIISYHEGSQWIIDGGTSQTFYSKHYDDQTDLFFAGKFIPMDKPVFKENLNEL